MIGHAHDIEKWLDGALRALPVSHEGHPQP
jgi:hypothetical protein